ncbi:MAG: hypothetical protein ACR2PA_11770 [Hyphomicrobiaceae bacterium]
MNLPVFDRFRELVGWFQDFLPHRFDRGRIETFEALTEFIDSRSAFVSQKSLYGYLKTRMGTRYPELFQDDVFVASINFAKWQVYSACLSDLAIFTAAHCAAETGLDDSDTQRLALASIEQIVAQSFAAPEAAETRDRVVPEFLQRMKTIDWSRMADRDAAFSVSPVELVRAAPVTDEFKVDDSEIVMNSIRFRWRDIREGWRKRADAQAIVSDWRARGPAGEAP